MPGPLTDRLRIRGADVHELASVYLANRGRLADPGPTDLPSDRAARLLKQATCGYALGVPLAEVREHGRAALLAFRVVQGSRPSRERLTTRNAVLTDPSLGLHSPTLVARVDGSRAAGYVAIRYLYWALLLRESELAAELAADVWDPGPPYEPAFQLNLVAHALRDLLADDRDAALDRLSRVRRSATRHEHQQAAAISALARDDADAAARAIGELAAWHRRAKVNESRATEKALCRCASGLGALALDRGLVAAENLPVAADTFATDLVLAPPQPPPETR